LRHGQARMKHGRSARVRHGQARVRHGRSESGFALLLVFLMAALVAISLYMEIHA